MANIFKNFDAKKTGIFAGGVLFGTAGIKILASDDAKKFYANCTAAVLRAKSCVMKQLSVAGGGQDPLTYAEKLGISDMNMSKTVWCQNKTRDIKIIVDFNMNNQVPFFRMKPRHYRVCASTRVWSGV